MIYLASASPRRRELLAQLQQPFTLLKVDVDETPLPNEPALELVARLAASKAQAGVSVRTEPYPVLGADTIVVVEGQVLGKPQNEADGKAMLRLLSGRTHQVHTAIALADSAYCNVRVVSSEVSFRPLTASDIDWYWQTGEPCDKAGGYGIQGLGGRFVSHLSGSYFAVMGLPLLETEQLIAECGAKA